MNPMDIWTRAYYDSHALAKSEDAPDVWRKLVRGQISDWLMRENIKLNTRRNSLLDLIEWDAHPATYEGFTALWKEAHVVHEEDQGWNKKALALRADIQNWLMSQYGMNKGAAMVIINKASGITDNFRATRSKGIAICHAAAETLINQRKDAPEWMLDDDAFLMLYEYAHAIYEDAIPPIPVAERGQRFNKAIGSLYSIYAFTGSLTDAMKCVEDFEMTNKPAVTQQPLEGKPRAKSPLTALGSQIVPGAGEKAAESAKDDIAKIDRKVEEKMTSGLEGRSELTKDQARFKRWIAKANEQATALGVNPLLRNATYHDVLGVSSFDDPKCTWEHAEFWIVWGLLDKYGFKDGDSFHYDPEKIKPHIANLMNDLKLDKMQFKAAAGFDTLAKAFEKGTGEEGHIKPSALAKKIKAYVAARDSIIPDEDDEAPAPETNEQAAQSDDLPAAGGTGQDGDTEPSYAPAIPQERPSARPLAITTMTGVPIADIKKQLDRHLPSEAYGPIKFGQMSGRTDINGDAVRDRLDEVFGLEGYGWRITPNPICGRVEHRAEERKSNGKTQTWYVVSLVAHTFSYALIMPDGSIQWVDASTTSDMHDNMDEQYAKRGALTSLMKQFYRLLGGMNHILSGEYTHIEAQQDVARAKQQNRRLH